MRASSEGHEPSQQSQPLLAALLGVELARGPSTIRDGTSEALAAVVRDGRGPLRVARVNREGVDKIIPFPRLEERRFFGCECFIPAHMGNRDLLRGSQLLHGTVDGPDSFSPRTLLTRSEEELQAQADAEEGPVLVSQVVSQRVQDA